MKTSSTVEISNLNRRFKSRNKGKTRRHMQSETKKKRDKNKIREIEYQTREKNKCTGTQRQSYPAGQPTDNTANVQNANIGKTTKANQGNNE